MITKRVITCVSLGVLSVGAIALGIACGENENALFPDAVATCQATYGSNCGQACGADEDCGSGLFCRSNVCAVDCVPGKAECTDGSSCDEKGRCASTPKNAMFGEGADDGGQGGSDGGFAFDPDSSCADIDVSFDKTKPTVVLLVDQSNSMKELTTDSVTRWDAVRTALMAADGGVVKQLEGDVSFGLALYTHKNSDGVCPRIVDVAPMFGNYNAINAVYGTATYRDNTPTGDSVLKVAGLNDSGVPTAGGFAASDAGGPKIIVLATDGDPDMCGAPDSNGTDPPKQLSVYATQKAFAAGIKTFVIAVGNDVSETHQREVANAGAGLPVGAAGDAGATYYRANNRASLVDAFKEIVTGTRSCTFTLRGEVVAGTEDSGRVTLNGTTLARNATNGWRLNGRNDVELLGSSCATVKTAPEAEVKVRFPCGAVVNIPSGPR